MASFAFLSARLALIVIVPHTAFGLGQQWR
jgi:hypothetical protein